MSFYFSDQGRVVAVLRVFQPSLDLVQRLRQSFVAVLGAHEGVVTELGDAAVMAADQQKAHHHRVQSLVQVRKGGEVALGFGHLLAADGQHVVVHPVAGKGVPRRLGLSDLGLVVRKFQVQPAAVDVEALAQILEAHGAALDVPAGETLPPGRVPAHDVARLGQLPEGEVAGVALITPHLLARAFLLIVEFSARQHAVARPAPNIEIHAARRLVGVTAPDQFLNQCDLFTDVSGGARLDAGPQHVQSAHVVHEAPEILLGHLHRLQLLQAGAGQHLVLAVVGVVLQVAHVGDVAHVTHRVTQVQKVAPDHVEGHLLLGVSHVGVAVDSGSAQVHADAACRCGLELYLAAL